MSWILVPFNTVRAYWRALKEVKECRYPEELLQKQRDYGQEQFDKLIVYLSGGAIALSVGFVKDLVGEASPSETYFLKLAWGAFASALCLNLLSHKTSVIDVDSELKGKNALSSFWGMTTEIFNWLSFIAFIGGVVCFVAFAYPKLELDGKDPASKSGASTAISTDTETQDRENETTPATTSQEVKPHQPMRDTLTTNAEVHGKEEIRQKGENQLPTK